MKRNSKFYKGAITERERLIRQRDSLQRQIDAFNVILAGVEKRGSLGKQRQELSLFPVEKVGRQNSLVSTLWNILQSDKAFTSAFGVKEVVPKLAAAGRSTKSTVLSAALKRLVDLEKLTLVRPGENRWKPAKYSIRAMRN